MSCIEDMTEAGKLEVSRWTLKQQFHARKYTPGRCYLWLKSSDWQNIQKLETEEEKLAKMIDDVIYIGIDCSDEEERFKSHLSSFMHGSPFDRYLKLALSNEEKFVSIYFGEKTSHNILYETLMINQLNMLKASRNVPKLFNVMTITLGDLIDNHNSNAFTSVLVYFFKQALASPDVKTNTDLHIQKAKSYLANLSKLHTKQLKTFVKETIARMHKNNGEVQLNDDELKEHYDLIEEAVDWSIFKWENNTLKLNCTH